MEDLLNSFRPEVLKHNRMNNALGVLDVPTADDSPNLGSLDVNGANGLCDGDLATADL